MNAGAINLRNALILKFCLEIFFYFYQYCLKKCLKGESKIKKIICLNKHKAEGNIEHFKLLIRLLSRRTISLFA